MKPAERDQLIDALIENALSEADFLRLEAELSVDPAARQEYYRRLTLSGLLADEAGRSIEGQRKPNPFPKGHVRRWWIPAAAAAAVAVVAGWSAGKSFHTKPGTAQAASPPQEAQARGFAVLTGQSSAVWQGIQAPAEGSLLPSGPLHLTAGVAQLELFSGVTCIVEGDAEFEVLSPMEMTVSRGKVRAHVPEAAHGFRIRTAEGEVVDLGTEFAMDVTADKAEVHVIEGQVEWHPRSETMRTMSSGEAVRQGTDGVRTSLAADPRGFVGMEELTERLASDRAARRAGWERFSEEMQHDPRVVLYYRMGGASPSGRRIANLAASTVQSGADGAIVGAARVPDRWGDPEGALDFSPTGSRVRAQVPGGFGSLSLICWVRINSLDRRYNSLFLTDGHDLHEPHWQLMDDGRLFFSVKKNDTWNPSIGQADKHIFYSPKFWDTSLSGQWLMLATVYDAEGRRVSHYLNGAPLSSESVPEEYLVKEVSIGAASLGNWGLPERDDPDFAVRNLNGSMDEFTLFAAALTPEEIARLHENGKP